MGPLGAFLLSLNQSRKVLNQHIQQLCLLKKKKKIQIKNRHNIFRALIRGVIFYTLVDIEGVDEGEKKISRLFSGQY